MQAGTERDRDTDTERQRDRETERERQREPGKTTLSHPEVCYLYVPINFSLIINRINSNFQNQLFQNQLFPELHIQDHGQQLELVDAVQ